VESAELAIEFSKESCRWRVLGKAAEVHVSEQRAKIIATLREAGEPMEITALAEATGMKRNPLELLLGPWPRAVRFRGWARVSTPTRTTPRVRT
jgi:hypothetical protein